MKHVYKPMLNQHPIQNTPFSWGLTLVNFYFRRMVMNGWMKIFALTITTVGFVSSSAAACESEMAKFNTMQITGGSSARAEPAVFSNYARFSKDQIDAMTLRMKSDIAAFSKNMSSAFASSGIAWAEIHLCFLNAASQQTTGQKDSVVGSKNISSSGTTSQQPQFTQQQSQQAQQQAQQTQPTGPKENCEALFTAERRQRLPGPQYAQEYTDCLGRILARSKAQTAAPKENCEALFTAERRQKLSGPQYAQEYTDCLGRILARSKVQTAAPVVAPTTQDAQQQAQQKTHDPAAKAHECIAIDNAGSGNFGAFKNICGYKVNFLTCNYKPRVIQGGFNWSADFNCEQQKLGMV